MNPVFFLTTTLIVLAFLLVVNEFYEFHLSRIQTKKERQNPLLDMQLSEAKAKCIRKRLKQNGYDPKAFFHWLDYVSAPSQELRDFNRHLDKRKDSLYHRPAKKRSYMPKSYPGFWASVLQTFQKWLHHCNRPIKFSEPFKHLENNA